MLDVGGMVGGVSCARCREVSCARCGRSFMCCLLEGWWDESRVLVVGDVSVGRASFP